MISITIPLPPSANTLYRNVPGKGRVKTSRYRSWLSAAGWAIKEQRPQRISGDYDICIHAGRPDRRRRDLDNIVKAVSDLLKKHDLIDDDSLASRIVLEWRDDIEGVRVMVWPWNPLASERSAA